MSRSGDLDTVLDRFQDWLASARTTAASAVESAARLDLHDDSDRPFGLVEMVEEFTAMRQELKLQTKSARALQEQSESLLPSLRQAIEHFRSVTPREEQAAWTAGKPLAEGLATLDEALDRCRGEIEKARIVATEQVPRKLVAALDQVHSGLPWLRRVLLRKYHQQVTELVKREAQGINQEWLESLLEGFDLIQNRVRRVLKSEGIAPIDCVGRPVDPERMIVIEITEAQDLPPQTVIEELRRGYTWKGRVLRLAEVKAVRGKPIEEPSEETDGAEEGELPDATVHESFGDNGSQSDWLGTE
ncbi:MAG: nucleotide exchange factor GrpE [Isosphaeraceae bacterium]